MKQHHKKFGFTIIEVSLFLALSGFLLVGIIVGANTSISRQRYADAVNSFAEQIRGVYSDVLNVSNDKDPSQASEKAGRTATAVYGKLISFGECTSLSADCSNTNNMDPKIYIYDIVGTAVSSASVTGGRTIDMLYSEVGSGGVNANIIDKSGCTGAVGCNNKFYRMNEYSVPWQGTIGRGIDAGSNNGARFQGAILVVRSPSTGSIRTYTYIYPSGNAAKTYSFHLKLTNSSAYNDFRKLLEAVKAPQNNYGENELTICVDSDDNTNSNRRGLIITKQANNQSGIKVTEMDMKENENESGPRCSGRNK